VPGVTDWQIRAEDLASRTWDVAVVGCGPSGAVAAQQLAVRGFGVVALDRHAFPRDKICGDALIPDALAVLRRIGLLERVTACGHAATQLRFFSPSRIEVPLAVTACVVRREVLDAIVAEAAADAGAVIARGQVVRIEAADDRVVTLVLREGAPVTARIAILATGADLRLLNGAGIVPRLPPTGIAVRRYVRSEARIDDLVVSFEKTIDGGYAWIFPLGNGQYNVGCGLSPRPSRRVDLGHTLDLFLERSPVARELRNSMISQSSVAGAVLRAGLRGAPLRRPANVLVVGEAIGATFPLSGEGIGKAMQTGEWAAAAVADALVAGDLSLLSSYEKRVAALRPLYGGYDVAQRWLARPWLNDTIAALVRGSPAVIQQLEGILSETVDPRRVFSLRGVWRMITR
jgi:geranylgeranyl reductase family protein